MYGLDQTLKPKANMCAFVDQGSVVPHARPVPDLDVERLRMQAIAISLELSDAGVGSGTLLEGVRQLARERAALQVERDHLDKALTQSVDASVTLSHDVAKAEAAALNAIADIVLAYRPKAKSKPARRRKRRAAKIAKGPI